MIRRCKTIVVTDKLPEKDSLVAQPQQRERLGRLAAEGE